MRRLPPSPALVISCLSLFVALGGTGYAALKLPAKSVGQRQLKPKSVTNPKLARGAVTGDKVRDGSLRRSDFRAGELPATATSAQLGVGPRGDRGPQGERGPSEARGVRVGTPVTIGTLSTRIATLRGLAPGSYAIDAKAVVVSTNPTPGTGSPVGANCDLVAEGDVDTAIVRHRPASTTVPYDSWDTVSVQVLHTSASTFDAKLECGATGGVDVDVRLADVRAVRLGSETHAAE